MAIIIKRKWDHVGHAIVSIVAYYGLPLQLQGNIKRYSYLKA